MVFLSKLKRISFVLESFMISLKHGVVENLGVEAAKPFLGS